MYAVIESSFSSGSKYAITCTKNGGFDYKYVTRQAAFDWIEKYEDKKSISQADLEYIYNYLLPVGG